MQPFSARTAATFALKALSTSSRHPGLAVMMAMTRIIEVLTRAFSSEVGAGSREENALKQNLNPLRLDLEAAFRRRLMVRTA
jgi:hypothetical protein